MLFFLNCLIFQTLKYSIHLTMLFICNVRSIFSLLLFLNCSVLFFCLKKTFSTLPRALEGKKVFLPCTQIASMFIKINDFRSKMQYQNTSKHFRFSPLLKNIKKYSPSRKMKSKLSFPDFTLLQSNLSFLSE